LSAGQIIVRTWRPIWPIAIAILVGLLVAILPLPVAGALLAVVGLVLLMLIQPLVGVALVLLIGPLGALESNIIGPSLPKSGQILFVLTVAAWLGYGVLRRRINIPRTALNLPLLLFLTAAGLSLLDASSIWAGFKEVIKWVGLGAAMILVTDLALSWRMLDIDAKPVNSRRQAGVDFRWLVAMLLLAGVSQAVLGIWQFGLRGSGPDHFMILDRFFRAFGTFQQPNPFGGYMSMTASLAIGAVIGLIMFWLTKVRAERGWQVGDWMWLIFLVICAGILGLALIMSWSRGAWIGFVAAMAVLTFFLPKRRWVGLILVLVTLGAIVILIQVNLVPESITGRLVSFGTDLFVGDVRGVHVTEENFSVIERLAHWQAGLDMARENLWLGVGFGNYEPAYVDYGLLNWPHPLGHAHNYYLNMLAETGLLGTLAYLALWAVVFFQLLKMLRRLEWPDRGIALGLLAAWTALAVHHMFDKLYVNNLYLFMGVMLGLQQALALKDD
jgi:O-antigen ligase